MGVYVKKRVSKIKCLKHQVQAVQLGNNGILEDIPIPYWFTKAVQDGDIFYDNKNNLYVRNPWRIYQAHPTDYIIRFHTGSYCVCKDFVFDKVFVKA